MPRPLKLLAYLFLAILTLMLGLAAFISATFNPNDYKDTVIKLVAEKKQRTLRIPGQISLKFFPKIGINLGQISISEHNSEQEFAAMEHASVSLALLPLLKKELVVDKIIVDGLRANILRKRDGKMNFDDLLEKEEKSSDKLRFEIDGISISNANISVDDQAEKRKMNLTKLDLETGPIANGVASKLKLKAHFSASAPKLEADLAATAGFSIDLEQGNYSFKQLALQIDGQYEAFSKLALKAEGDGQFKMATKEINLADLKLAVQAVQAAQNIDLSVNIPKFALLDKEVQADKITGKANLRNGKDKVELELSAPSFKGSRSELNIPQIALQILLEQGQVQAKGSLETELLADLDKMLIRSKAVKLQMSGSQGSNKLGATLASPMTINLERGKLDLPQLNMQLSLPHPAGAASGTLGLQAAGNLQFDWIAQSLASVLKGRLDETNFDAKFGLQNFAKPHYRANLQLDKIDADRYRPRAVEAAAREASGPAAAAKPETPLDLRALANLHADASVAVGEIRFANMKLQQLKFDLHGQPGKVELAPLSANLYGGSVQGSLAVLLNKGQQFVIKQNLTGIALGPLLKDAIKKNPIDGRGNVVLDVRTEGGTVAQWKKALAGNARVSLQDGSISGFNLAKIIRGGKSMLGAANSGAAAGGTQTGTANADDKTDFSEFSASFKIAGGVAHNDDLAIKSPLFRVAGNGDVNLGEEKLDYLVKPTIVASLQGQGGPELQALKGLTIPVRLTGPFTAISWKIDVGALAKEAAAQKINEKKEEVKTKLQDKLKDSLKGLFGG